MRVLLAVAVLMLSGCASMLPAFLTVRVPVPVPCNVPAIARPVLPVDSLNVDDNVFVVNRALWATDEIREGYEIRLVAALDSCREKPAVK